jgi:Flp pilus assembly protein TadD
MAMVQQWWELVQRLKNTDFQNLIKEDPKNARLYVDLAECYAQCSKTEEAIRVLETYTKFDSRNPIVKSNLEKLKK